MLKKSVILLSTLLCFFLLAEVTAWLSFSRFQAQPAIVQGANEVLLTWARLPFWAIYDIEVYQSPTAVNPLRRYSTWQNQRKLKLIFPLPTVLRVSARGLLGLPLGIRSAPVVLPEMQSIAGMTALETKPVETLRTSWQKQNTDNPILSWTSMPGAVYYEIEFLSRPAETPNNILPSRFRVHSSRQVFVNGYHPDLRAFRGQRLYWRVRGLDLDGNPVGVYSDTGTVDVASVSTRQLKPIILSDFYASNAVPLLYPVYEWIPLQGAAAYEVELTRVPPENPDTAEPSKHRIWHGQAKGFDLYDYTARMDPGRYYYRVRGLTTDGEPVGVWSDTASFDVDLTKGYYVSTFGDSITHGGGALSYSPSDWEYSYQSYLKFPTYNLGRSSDTSELSAERFEQDVLPFHPKYLLIMTGSNSVRAGVSAESMIRDFTVIRDKCLENNIRPIFMTLPPIRPDAIARAFREPTAPNWQDELSAVNGWIRRQSFFIDLYPHFVDENGELFPQYAVDGLHFDIAGKKLMAALINAHWEEVSR